MADHPDTVVLRVDGHRVPRSLTDLPAHRAGRVATDTITDTTTDIATAVDATVGTARRIVVVGADAALAAVLTRLLRIDRLDVEVAPVGAVTGAVPARRARTAAAQRVPLIRDETGQVIVGGALWLPTAGGAALHGEAVVDDTVLFDGDSPAVVVEPTATLPGLRARVRTGRFGGRWIVGRAAQLGTTGARVIRDGVEAPREVRRSTFYRHTEGWLRVG